MPSIECRLVLGVQQFLFHSKVPAPRYSLRGKLPYLSELLPEDLKALSWQLTATAVVSRLASTHRIRGRISIGYEVASLSSYALLLRAVLADRLPHETQPASSKRSPRASTDFRH